ncbi:hypothetical protein LZ30DRAFT_696074 [Colletotrichum cereale]|nr:hypothetical protein LZ30DRAFT_696074 [Colletotrichum cereale]
MNCPFPGTQRIPTIRSTPISSFQERIRRTRPRKSPTSGPSSCPRTPTEAHQWNPPPGGSEEKFVCKLRGFKELPCACRGLVKTRRLDDVICANVESKDSRRWPDK